MPTRPPQQSQRTHLEQSIKFQMQPNLAEPCLDRPNVYLVWQHAGPILSSHALSLRSNGGCHLQQPRCQVANCSKVLSTLQAPP